MHNDSKYSYPHFLRTLTHACYRTRPALADRWPTLDEDARFMVLQAWLTVYDPEACDWDETATDEQKLEFLATVLKRLHEEYRDQVLYACYNWKPGMVYSYKGNPQYPLQPSGSGIAGPNVVGFHGMGERVEPVEDSAGAWQDHCARLLAQRWAEQAEPEAMGIDILDWLAQGDEEDDSVFS